MAYYRRTARGLRVAHTTKPSICSQCKSTIPIGVPHIVTIDLTGKITSKSFKVCPRCIHEAAVQMLDMIDNQELYNEFLGDRFVNSI